ncbi:MAG: DUF2480 family protein [Candidatus Zixiibacteriota bacterium]
MAFDIIDPTDFLSEGRFSEEKFFPLAEGYDWSKHTGKMVLVRGCSTILPPWVFMYITAQLAPYAKSIRYGNEHDNVTVFRHAKDKDV